MALAPGLLGGTERPRRMGRRDAARVPGRERRSPSVPGGGWTGGSQAASPARGAAPLPLLLPSSLPRLSRGSSSPAAPRRTWLHPPPPEPTSGAVRPRTWPGAGARTPRGASRPPVALVPGLLRSASGVPSHACVVLLSAEPRTSLFSHAPLGTLSLVHHFFPSLPFPSPSVCGFGSRWAFPPCADRPSLCLDARSASRLRGPSPLPTHALQHSRPVGGPGSERYPSSLRVSSILAGVASQGLAPTLLMSTLAQRPLGN